MVTIRIVRWAYRFARWTLNIVLSGLTVIGVKPELAELMNVGAATISFLQKPIVLVLVVAVLTASVLCDFLWHRARASMRKLLRDEIVPDMLIEEVARHLRFSSEWATVFTDSDKCILKVCPEIEEKARLMQVQIWGVNQMSGDRVRSLVPPEVWTGWALQSSTILFDSDGDKTPSMAVVPGVAKIQDLFLCRAQVLRIWPMAPWYLRLFLARRMQNVALDNNAKRRMDRYLHNRRAIKRMGRAAFRRAVRTRSHLRRGYR